MPNVEYALASGHSVRYLDVAPMIAALGSSPPISNILMAGCTMRQAAVASSSTGRDA